MTLTVSGTNGVPNINYYVLASTNAAMPVTNWTRIATIAFDSDGNFSFTNALDLTAPRRFFLIQLP
jgi:hypothetical protein